MKGEWLVCVSMVMASSMNSGLLCCAVPSMVIWHFHGILCVVCLSSLSTDSDGSIERHSTWTLYFSSPLPYIYHHLFYPRPCNNFLHYLQQSLTFLLALLSLLGVSVFVVTSSFSFFFSLSVHFGCWLNNGGRQGLLQFA
jgi:hypothetical protein